MTLNQLTIVVGILAAQIVNWLIADPVPEGATAELIRQSWNGHFPILHRILGPARTFWIYGVLCLAGLLFVFWRVPETKGRTLEQIEYAFAGAAKRPRSDAAST